MIKMGLCYSDKKSIAAASVSEAYLSRYRIFHIMTYESLNVTHGLFRGRIFIGTSVCNTA